MLREYRQGEVVIIPTSYGDRFIKDGYLTVEMVEFGEAGLLSDGGVREAIHLRPGSEFWNVITSKGVENFKELKPYMEKENIEALKLQRVIPREA